MAGNAFNRTEVASVYVQPDDRFIVSFVVGFSKEQVDTVLEAAQAALRMVCHQETEGTQISVYDRQTGESFIMTKAQVFTTIPQALGDA